jgi:hypothetical protein
MAVYRMLKSEDQVEETADAADDRLLRDLPGQRSSYPPIASSFLESVRSGCRWRSTGFLQSEDQVDAIAGIPTNSVLIFSLRCTGRDSLGHSAILGVSAWSR